MQLKMSFQTRASFSKRSEAAMNMNETTASDREHPKSDPITVEVLSDDGHGVADD